MVAVHFLLQSQGGAGEFMYKASILGNKQLLSSMIDHKATQVPYTTRIAFLTDSYILLKRPSHSLALHSLYSINHPQPKRHTRVTLLCKSKNSHGIKPCMHVK